MFSHLVKIPYPETANNHRRGSTQKAFTRFGRRCTFLAMYKRKNNEANSQTSPSGEEVYIWPTQSPYRPQACSFLELSAWPAGEARRSNGVRPAASPGSAVVQKMDQTKAYHYGYVRACGT